MFKNVRIILCNRQFLFNPTRIYRKNAVKEFLCKILIFYLVLISTERDNEVCRK